MYKIVASNPRCIYSKKKCSIKGFCLFLKLRKFSVKDKWFRINTLSQYDKFESRKSLKEI